ncbi:MAG: hypothetical protein ACXVP2_13560 [Tumebacillaceae bacterium]
MSSQREAFLPPVPQMVPTPIRPVARFEPASPVAPDSFWGNIGEFVSGAPSAQEVAEDLHATIDLPPLSAVAPVATPPVEPVATRVQTEAKTQESPSDHVYEAAASKESEAVSTEIASIRNRYIVGKMAGEDLLDNQNRLIVAKGEVISAEVVEIAEREGRLPDLIVNMKIPGVSVDKS